METMTDGRREATTRRAVLKAAGSTTASGALATLFAQNGAVKTVTPTKPDDHNYLHGYFGGFGRVAEEAVDFLVHLGDFGYEYAGDGQQPGRDIRLRSGKDIAHGLEDFRHLYRTYRSDELLPISSRYVRGAYLLLVGQLTHCNGYH
ncbi:alkaline phosphatase D family protein [Halomicrococcus sp. NG-SE-24]|uniref:alkaline phosphatase D family protein n=1 Tax=Halomicrococcus sp. NG-SE-24 TaxID=3436928 RepID=UPI003D9758D2